MRERGYGEVGWASSVSIWSSEENAMPASSAGDDDGDADKDEGSG